MAKHNLKEFNMKRSCSIHISGKKSHHYNNLQAFFLETRMYLQTSVRLCSSIVKRATGNLWSGSSSSILFGRQVEGTARYIHFTRRLPVIQNLDFCLTGWKTKDTLESCHGCYKQLPVQLDTSWPLSLRNVIKGRGLGISPSYYEHEPQLFS